MKPKVFDLLLYLIENRDRLVTKDNLIAEVWGGRIVSDSALTGAVNASRKAVGDSGRERLNTALSAGSSSIQSPSLLQYQPGRKA